MTPPMGPGDRKVIPFTVYIPLVLEMIQTKVVTIGLVFFKKKLKMKNHKQKTHDDGRRLMAIARSPE